MLEIIENDFCDLIFISHVVWQVLPERSTMVLPLDEVSKYFIPKKTAKNRFLYTWTDALFMPLDRRKTCLWTSGK